MTEKTTLVRNEDNSFEIQIVIPRQKIATEYQSILKEKAKNISIKGFRKGQAPLNLIEEKLGKDSIYQELISKLINQTYLELIKKHDLKPVIPPKVSLISAKEKEDWKLKIIACELPKIETEGLVDKIKKANTKGKIWTPNKNKDIPDKKDGENREVKIQEIIKTIIETVKINLPSILLEHEINKKLAALIEQLEKVGLKVDQFLASRDKTLDQIKQEYQKEIEANWKIDLTLEKLADDHNIIVTEKEVKDLEKGTPGTGKLNAPKINPYLATRILRREKTLAHLLSL